MPDIQQQRTLSHQAIQIRPFAAADQDAVRHLILDGLGDHFGLVDQTRNPDLDDIMMSYVEQGAVFVVAERRGAIVGCGALLRRERGMSQIARVSVDRGCRRTGLGRAIVAWLVERARQRGDVAVEVETNHDWLDAVGLYRACGFAPFDRDEESVYLRLDLAAR